MTSKEHSGAMPWLDLRLTKETMDHLWDCINNPTNTQDKDTVETTSKSKHIQDKNNWLYENVLKEVSEHLYFKDWNSYFEVAISKSKSLPTFILKALWVNYQKQKEFVPPHGHGSVFSFVIFMKIPTHWKEQHTIPNNETNASIISLPSCVSDFQFLLGQGQGEILPICIPLCPEDEGRMLFFPAWLHHQVFPFFGTEKDRITVSGNIVIEEVEQRRTNEMLIALENMEAQAKLIRESIKQEKINDEQKTNSENSQRKWSQR